MRRGILGEICNAISLRSVTVQFSRKLLVNEADKGVIVAPCHNTVTQPAFASRTEPSRVGNARQQKSQNRSNRLNYNASRHNSALRKITY